MKKVLSFVLVLALVLGSFSMAFADVQADVVGKTCEKAVTALENLGVVAGYPDGTFKPENNVTRAEAAKMIIAALGLTAQAEGNTTTFSDCQGHWAAGYIGYAQALGVLKGVGNNKFNPGGNVTYQETLTMIVRAVGYTDASLPGTWPANYVAKAKALGLLKNVDKAGNQAASRGDVAIMIYNNLENPLGYIDNDNVFQSNVPAETMLSRLDTYINAGDKEIVLDANLDYAKGVNLSNYYGAYAKVYLNDDNEITGIKEVKSTFITVNVTTDSAIANVGISNDDVKYINKLTANNGIAVFENSRAKATINTTQAATLGDQIATNYTGFKSGDELTLAVKLDGKQVKSIYSINKLTAKATVVWDDKYSKKVSKNHEIAAGAKFTEDNKGEIDKTGFALLGAKDISSIANDGIVTYYVDASGYVTRVEVSTTTVNGKVTRVKGNNGVDGTKYTINGTVYKLAQVSGEVSDLKLNAEGTAYLNYAGKIAKFKGTSQPDNYAMVADAGKVVTGDYEGNKLQVKLFTADGAKKVYTVNEDTMINGTIKANAEATVAAVLLKDNFATYTLNKDGEIDSLKVEAGTSVKAEKFANNGYLSGKELDAKVVVFTGTGNGTFAVGSLKDIPTSEKLDPAKTKYIMDTDQKKIVAVWTNESSSNTYGLITDFGKVKNSSDKEVYEVKALVNGKEVTYLTKDLTFDPGTIKDAQLVDFQFDGSELKTAVATKPGMTKGAVTDGGVGKGTLDLGDGAGYVQVSNAHVYKVVIANDGTFDKMVVGDYSDITAGDGVILFESDDDVQGYDIIIYVAEDDNSKFLTACPGLNY